MTESRFVFFSLIREGRGMLPFPPEETAGTVHTMGIGTPGYTLDELQDPY